MIRKIKFVHVQYGHHHYRPNYIGHISKNVTFSLNICDPWLVELELTDMEGHLYCH